MFVTDVLSDNLSGRFFPVQNHVSLKRTSGCRNITYNSSLKKYLNPDDHTIGRTDTPGLKPAPLLPTYVFPVAWCPIVSCRVSCVSNETPYSGIDSALD